MINKKLVITARHYNWLVRHYGEVKEVKKVAPKGFCSILDWELADTKEKMKACKKELDFFGATREQIRQYAI
jgi:hypothetical protein